MKVHVYLRASTKDQDAQRAKLELHSFATTNGYDLTEDLFYIENISGTRLERPELNRLLESASSGDCILIEDIDRLSRLPLAQWEKLKAKIKEAGLKLVVKNIPTSHAALTMKENSFANSMIDIINNLLVDMFALTARKSYEDIKHRQAQGISKILNDPVLKAKKYKGKQITLEQKQTFNKALVLITERHLSKAEACKLADINLKTFYRLLKQQENKPFNI